MKKIPSWMKPYIKTIFIYPDKEIIRLFNVDYADVLTTEPDYHNSIQVKARIQTLIYLRAAGQLK